MLLDLAKPERIIHGLTNSAKSLVLSSLMASSKQAMVFVVQNHHDAQIYYQEIKNLISYSKNETPVFNFLSQEISPYDQINSDIGVLRAQYEVFESWSKQEKSFTIINQKALSQLYFNQQLLQESKLILRKASEIEPLELARKLLGYGYFSEAMVESRGQFSLRGDIFDIYPLLGEPMRLEFFGDQIESIRTFNTNTQRSIKEESELIIHPRFLFLRNEGDKFIEELGLYSSRYLKNLKEESKITLESQLSYENLYWEGIEYYREISGQKPSGIFEYMPENLHLIFDEWQDISIACQRWDEKLQEQYEEGVNSGELLALRNPLHLSSDEIFQGLKSFKFRLFLQTFVEPGSEDRDLSYELISYPAPKFASKIEELVSYIKEILKDKQRLVIFSEQPQRILGILREWDIGAIYSLDEDPLDSKLPILVQRDGLEEGCKIPSLNLLVLTDREMFGRSRQAIAKQKSQRPSDRSAREIYTDISELKVNDYVVHYKHGIGIYRGTEFVKLDEGRLVQEYLAIEYADEARILIPVSQVNLLSRFNTSGDVKPRLSKLGGLEWERTKKKVQKSVRKIAQDLINLYAVRAKQTGYKYPPDTPWQIEMEDAFPYTETKDQLQAVLEVKQDMESERLIDRLICGDAGFGKTEVIIRTVFKVIMEGKQAAILVPTTVLAQQHFNVFGDRYAPYPIRIGLLSRFRSPKEQKEVVSKLNSGELDLVIGTHRLLQKDIKFKNLALLVIDEEQRFGVAHKEKLKSFRKDLDVISMSATPIPRTLHMSISGIKDISLISTPPTNRLPVKTFVGEYKPSIIRNAILHEIERGGNIFFVHNRVETIERMAYELQELTPEAKIRIAHGQMKDAELEDVMFSFVNNEFDVLVCTTIIETGLDIANANTIIINRANAFGLSQLYQLRGRVGRSDVQAYAYLLYNPSDDISDSARRRLQAIREHTNLGSGYQIALRDMEIRGVGNVFGAEQHGHMLAVGFDLYCKILSDTIELMKGNLDEDDLREACTVDIKISAFFPETWVYDSKQRMNEYKRLALIKDESSLDYLLTEWLDRFGKLPKEAENLLELTRLKILGNKAKVTSISQEAEDIKIYANIRLQQWIPIQRSLSSFFQSRCTFKSSSLSSKYSQAYILIKVDNIGIADRLDLLKEILQKLV
jgi:transcription-repair coupling factor (superfamily II helicase)